MGNRNPMTKLATNPNSPPSSSSLIRVCRFCGDPFRPLDRRQWYCSPRHRFAEKLRRQGIKWSKTSLAEFFALCEAADWKCAYCGRQVDPFTVRAEHDIPRSRGGSDNIANIVPACSSCNSRKGTK